jgi:hypothetical protein
MLNLKEVNFSETRFYQDVLQKGLERGLPQRESDLVLRQLQRRCGVILIVDVSRALAMPPAG